MIPIIATIIVIVIAGHVCWSGNCQFSISDYPVCQTNFRLPITDCHLVLVADYWLWETNGSLLITVSSISSVNFSPQNRQQTDRETKKQTDRQTDIMTDGQASRWAGRQTDKQTQTVRHADRQSRKAQQAGRQTNRKTVRQTKGQTDSQKSVRRKKGNKEVTENKLRCGCSRHPHQTCVLSSDISTFYCNATKVL